MSQAALAPSHLGWFAARWQSKDFSDSRVQKLQEVALVTPEPLSAARQESLEGQQVWQEGAEAMPGWAREVAKAREHFGQAALMFMVGPRNWEFWKI
eukprot:9352404-Alexandrium_andersonii.AAC.1